MSNEKVSDLNAGLKVLEKEHEILTKHHDKIFDILDGIKTDLSKLVSIEERQSQVTDMLNRIEKHNSHQGKEIEELKENIHEFDIRIIRMEEATGSNTKVREKWGRITERVISSLIILALGAFIALKQ